MRFVWPESVRSELRSIDRESAMRILLGLTRYGESGEGDVKALSGEWEGCFRLRVGDFRVIFQIAPAAIEMIRVRHRSRIPIGEGSRLRCGIAIVSYELIRTQRISLTTGLYKWTSGTGPLRHQPSTMAAGHFLSAGLLLRSNVDLFLRRDTQCPPRAHKRSQSKPNDSSLTSLLWSRTDQGR